MGHKRRQRLKFQPVCILQNHKEEQNRAPDDHGNDPSSENEEAALV